MCCWVALSLERESMCLRGRTSLRRLCSTLLVRVRPVRSRHHENCHGLSPYRSVNHPVRCRLSAPVHGSTLKGKEGVVHYGPGLVRLRIYRCFLPIGPSFLVCLNSHHGLRCGRRINSSRN